ncbi:MAG: TetR family transcriptional regulator [Albidovulum sp.]|uniref:TetR/AcrR family transcriptional regulator n=1 Tax=Albidovulum sp. TaxID=1872424 RepID=UPI001323FC25|nr:TetR family transcriptional regulator C-terminal domain-containing protein [Defluviimonas sp.]KAB2877403.1 MAG: TetR family transcriptional regulator [Defluviimonas sp.]
MDRKLRAPRFTRMSGEDRRAALVSAGLACMAQGGIQAFTVDRVCAEAGVSRGLITHHFGSMNGLLAAVYARMYDDSTRPAHAAAPGATRLSALLDAYFAPELFNRDTLNIWLALWGQISVNADLREEHRVQYPAYVRDVAAAIGAVAAQNGREVDAGVLATTLIALVDGLGLQHCIDPGSMPADSARAACRSLLEPHLGPF